MSRLKRLFPDALAGRIVLLLAVTIIAANLIALAILNFEQQRLNLQAGEDRKIERIVDLIPAMEAVDAEVRQVIARDASSRFARIRVENTPLLTETSADGRARHIAQRLTEILEREDIAVATVERSQNPGTQDHRASRQANRVTAITIPLSARAGRAEWLNVVTNRAPRRVGGVDGKPFLTVLVLSLLSVLGVAVVLARRLTKPLRQLSLAADAAGRGDRSAQVAEAGAREIRDAARAFNTMQAEISQFDKERMRLLAAVGHDLRTPMTSLRIRAEMIDDTKQREAMIRTLDEMRTMADGLVSFARDGQDAEEMAPLDLGPLLEQLCMDRGAECKVTLDSQVMGRRVSLGRGIGNLIDNALRFGKQTIVILSQDRQQAIITIEDNGPGIPPDRLDAMFQLFTRGDDSRSLDTGGAGLGLSIARSIIIAHGGRIALENRAEGGLRAIIALPLIKQT